MTNCRSLRLQGAGMQGCKRSAGVQGCSGAEVQRYSVAGLEGCWDVGVQGCRGAGMQRFLGPRVQE